MFDPILSKTLSFVVVQQNQMTRHPLYNKLQGVRNVVSRLLSCDNLRNNWGRFLILRRSEIKN